jgi:hypothetical protein
MLATRAPAAKASCLAEYVVRRRVFLSGGQEAFLEGHAHALAVLGGVPTGQATHLWWSAEGPQDDPLAYDGDQLAASRERLLAPEPGLSIPGHGAPFAPTGGH